MDVVKILEELLHVVSPFKINRVEKSDLKYEVHVYVEVDAAHRPADKLDWCINSYNKRSWEHLNLFEYRCFIHADIPEYRKDGKTFQLQVEFSRKHSRFTLLYEQRVMELMKIHHCFSRVAAQLGIYPQRVESIYHYYTENLCSNIAISNCPNIGFDETSTRKGHDYITVFVDMDSNRVIGIEDGKSIDAVALFASQHPAPETVKNISIDMSPAFTAAAEKYFPNAAITFDKWHVLKLLYKKLEEANPNAEIKDMLLLGMDNLGSFFNQKNEAAVNCQLLFMADFAEDNLGQNVFSKSIRQHFSGIVNHYSSKLTNGILEGINSTIQVLKRVARGFRYKDNFKKMVRFIFSDLYPTRTALQPKS